MTNFEKTLENLPITVLQNAPTNYIWISFEINNIQSDTPHIILAYPHWRSPNSPTVGAQPKMTI